MNTAVMFAKASDEWETPADLFADLNLEFNFDIDVAATFHTAKTRISINGREGVCYFGPDHADPSRRDALTNEWGHGAAWMNPPYSRVREFIAKAAAEARKGCTVVCLVPSRTDTHWWASFVWHTDTHHPRRGVEVRFLRGRLRFVGAKHSAPFPSVVLVFMPMLPLTQEKHDAAKP
jgi:hypothetical protein